jgi:regulation of enolase protein 1 (concanavalin A-like superfamily)
MVSAAALRVPLCATLFVCALSNVALAQSIPSPWKGTKLGSPALSGSATYPSGVFDIDAGGVDIWGTSDQGHFVYQAIAGDVEIVGRVDSLVQTDPWANAGLMIRSSLAANSAFGYATSTAANGVYFRRRLANGASASSVAGVKRAAPVWVRLVRRGNQVTGYSSTNGTSWTTVAASTIPLASTAYVGIAVTSHDAGTRTTARVSNVRVTRLSLPSGQQSRDIGSPAIAGSASYVSGTYTIKAAGRDIWDTADQFHFVYRPMTGNGEVIARVASITNTHAWAKAGVMIREALTAQSRHAMVVASIGKGYAFQRRPNPGAYSEHTPGGSGVPPGWVRLRRTGDLFEAYRSANGSTWTKIGSDTIPMGDTVYVGLAATSHNAAAATTVKITNFKVTAQASSNDPPAVSVTAPANGAKFTAPATMTISATATDPEGRMASVDFYAGTTLIRRDTTAPYSTSWSTSTAGTHSLTAVAHDQDGGTSTSGAVSVTVQSATAGPPRAIVFTASSNHATAVTSYTLKVFAASANPATATPIATSNLGKPTPASNGDITVDRATFFSALAAGSYKATVTAVGPGGQTQSAAIAFTR